MSDECYLYRHFSAKGELLYIGISLSSIMRLSQHADSSHWFHSIARVEIQQYKNRQSAARAEREAILRENPLHNIRGKKDINVQLEKSRAFLNAKVDLVDRVVNLHLVYEPAEVRRMLGVTRAYLDDMMDSGRLGFIEVPNKMGKLRRLITGWHLIEYFELCTLEAKIAGALVNKSSQIEEVPSIAGLSQRRHHGSG